MWMRNFEFAQPRIAWPHKSDEVDVVDQNGLNLRLVCVVSQQECPRSGRQRARARAREIPFGQHLHQC